MMKSKICKKLKDEIQNVIVDEFRKNNEGRPLDIREAFNYDKL